MNKKLRVWWTPQVGQCEKLFYVPVESVIEAKKIMNVLAYYDCFQYNNNIKPDYCNMGGLEQWNEEIGEWESWGDCEETDWFDDVDEYLKDKLEKDKFDELQEFSDYLLGQVEF